MNPTTNFVSINKAVKRIENAIWCSDDREELLATIEDILEQELGRA